MRRPPLLRIFMFASLGLVLLCVGLWLLVLRDAGQLGDSQPNLTATALAKNNQECQALIEKALQQSSDFCDKTGVNQLCYGHDSLQADLVQNTMQQFNALGDVINIESLKKLSAAPLNLDTNAWGIAVFKITANLPRSRPGEAVTMLVFGNTTLDKNEPGIHSYYFYSNTVQFICDEVPFDGLLISMPDGSGVTLSINGAELVLTGTASLSATQGGEMNINLYDGSAQVTAAGQTQAFGPGEQISIPLGGATGLEPEGPPSEPTPFGGEELTLSCTLTGQNCEQTPIPTVPENIIQATLAFELSPTPNAPTATDTATPASPSQTPIPPPSLTASPSASATILPTRTATFLPTWTRTKKPSDTPAPTSTFTPTITLTPTASNTFAACPSAGAISASGNTLSITISNNTGANIIMASLNLEWVDEPAEQSVTTITSQNFDIWSGNAESSPSTHNFSGAPLGQLQISAGNSKTITITFSQALAPGNYGLQLFFDGGCSISQSTTVP